VVSWAVTVGAEGGLRQACCCGQEKATMGNGRYGQLLHDKVRNLQGCCAVVLLGCYAVRLLGCYAAE